MGTRARTAVIAGTASLLVTGAATFGAASAAAQPARAEVPIIGKCGGTISGEPGTPVKVAGIKLGEIPESGTATLVGQIPLVGGLLGGLTKCTVTVVAEVSEPVSKPVQTVTEPVTKALPDPLGQTVEKLVGGQQPAQQTRSQTPSARDAVSRSPVVEQPEPTAAPMRFGPFTPAAGLHLGAIQQGVYDFSSVSYFDYSNLFTSLPGTYDFGAMDFSQLPRGDLFGTSNNLRAVSDVASPTARDVAAAGQAEALPTPDTDGVALPVLVAALALSGVAAGLVRAWVHGRSVPD